MEKEGKEIVWGGERKENESRKERGIGNMKGGGKREKGRVKKKRRIRSHLSRVADPDAIQQSKKLGCLGRLDDLGSRGSLIWLLLPAPHHQLTEEHRTGKVLEERERDIE